MGTVRRLEPDDDRSDGGGFLLEQIVIVDGPETSGLDVASRLPVARLRMYWAFMASPEVYNIEAVLEDRVALDS
jgi:hypothetical protein